MTTPTLSQPHYGIGPIGAAGRYFAKYFVFSGRASRAEYWWAWLFVGIVTAVLSGLSKLPSVGETIGIVGLVWLVLTIIPNLSVAVRRLHDRNKSGWMVLLPFVLTTVGQFVADFALERYMNGGSNDTTAFAWLVAGAVPLVIGVLASVILYVGGPRPEGARFDK